MSETAQNMTTIQDQNLPAAVTDRGLDAATWNALQNSLFPGATEDSVLMYVDYCRARKLDIMKKPAHIVPMNVKDAKTGKYTWRDVIMPAIYDYRATASRTGQYAGQDEPVYGQEIEYMGVTVPESCTVTVYKLVQGKIVPFSHTERFKEIAVCKKDNGRDVALNAMWTKRPYGQLAKCAEAGALRKAFPDEIGNELTAEEMAGRTIEHDTIDDDDHGQPGIQMPEASSEANNTDTGAGQAHGAGNQANAGQSQQAQQPQADGPKIAEGAKRVLLKKMMNKNVTEDRLCEQFRIKEVNDLNMAQLNPALEWLDSL